MAAMGRLRAARPPPTRPATAPEPGRGEASRWSHYRTRLLGVSTRRAGSDRHGRGAPFRAERGYGNDSRQNGPLSSRILHITCDCELAFSVKRELDSSDDEVPRTRE